MRSLVVLLAALVALTRAASIEKRCGGNAPCDDGPPLPPMRPPCRDPCPDPCPDPCDPPCPDPCDPPCPDPCDPPCPDPCDPPCPDPCDRSPCYPGYKRDVEAEAALEDNSWKKRDIAIESLSEEEMAEKRKKRDAWYERMAELKAKLSGGTAEREQDRPAYGQVRQKRSPLEDLKGLRHDAVLDALRDSMKDHFNK